MLRIVAPADSVDQIVRLVACVVEEDTLHKELLLIPRADCLTMPLLLSHRIEYSATMLTYLSSFKVGETYDPPVHHPQYPIRPTRLGISPQYQSLSPG